MDGSIKEGVLVSEKDASKTYPVVNYIPRFVPASNYADNFGFQWNKFSRTQFDSHTKLTITHDRFWKATGWDPTSMKDQYVLDVGCGSGRFAEICLQTKANLVAIDYSSAVDAAYQNLKEYDNLLLVQADVYHLPFAENSFPYASSLGYCSTHPM